jgi:hypothetical protein
LEAVKQSEPEAESAEREESGEDRMIEELKATKATLAENLRLRQHRNAEEREEKLRLEREEAADQVLKEQRAAAMKSLEAIGRAATETKKGVITPGAEGRQAMESEERRAAQVKQVASPAAEVDTEPRNLTTSTKQASC